MIGAFRNYMMAMWLLTIVLFVDNSADHIPTVAELNQSSNSGRICLNRSVHLHSSIGESKRGAESNTLARRFLSDMLSAPSPCALSCTHHCTGGLCRSQPQGRECQPLPPRHHQEMWHVHRGHVRLDPMFRAGQARRHYYCLAENQPRCYTSTFFTDDAARFERPQKCNCGLSFCAL